MELYRSAIALAALAGCPGWAMAQERLLGPMDAQLRNRVGQWCVTARLQFTPEARPLTINATAESRLIGGRWLVTELRGMDGLGGFHGIGVNGWDPDRQIYSGYWIDGTRGFTVPVEGRFDRGRGVFTTSSVERRRDGTTIEVMSETASNGPDEEVTTFTAPDAQGRRYQRMQLRYVRARPGAECPSRSARSGG